MIIKRAKAHELAGSLPNAGLALHCGTAHSPQHISEMLETTYRNGEVSKNMSK